MVDEKEPKKKIRRSPATEFKKGHKKSVGFGRPPMTPEQRAMAFKNRTDFKIAINKYMSCTLADLRKLKKSAKVTAFDKGIIQSLIDISNSGNQEKLIWFINQIHGKEKEVSHIELSGSTTNTTEIDLKKLTAEELLALKAIAEKAEGVSEQ